ncbi:glycosyltransferase family 2 protein [Edwardsiella tarda]|uniref:glycosyltransferase n=1 Tax=Edwardsiella tarda TaxID=636 RepID=UPI00351C9941
MTLDMLFSTYGSKIYNLMDNLPLKKNKVTIIIVHQITHDADYSEIASIMRDREDIIYIPTYTKGVTKSRNIAINNSKSDILLFCDDDVIYRNELYQIVMDAYLESNDDFITFAIEKKGCIDSKFRDSSHRHSLFSILSIGTIEVSVRRKAIINNMKLRFPENLGAGSRFFICDEPVFLSRLIKNNKKGKYIPNVICDHPDISSGNDFRNRDGIKARLLCFHYIFGKILGSILYSLFILKNHKKIGFDMMSFSLLKVYWYGED